jgi:hypothetical protein
LGQEKFEGSQTEHQNRFFLKCHTSSENNLRSYNFTLESQQKEISLDILSMLVMRMDFKQFWWDKQVVRHHIYLNDIQVWMQKNLTIKYATHVHDYKVLHIKPHQEISVGKFSQNSDFSKAWFILMQIVNLGNSELDTSVKNTSYADQLQLST